MYSFTVWSEGGGHGKSTISGGLAKGLERLDLDVLLVDLDGQKGCVSALYGLLNDTETEQGNSLIEFLADTADEDIRNLIKTKNGVDVLPSTPKLRDADQAIYKLGGPRQQEVPDEQLRRIIKESELYKDYDVMVVDVPKDINTATKNGLFATRNVLMPAKPAEKGKLSLDGFIENLHQYQRRKRLDDFGIVALVLNKVSDSLNISDEYRALLDDRREVYAEEAGFEFPLCPIEIRYLEALIEGAWAAHTDPFTFYLNEKERQYDTDREVLHRFDLLAEYVLYHLSGGEQGRIPTEEEIESRPTHGDLFPVDTNSAESANAD